MFSTERLPHFTVHLLIMMEVVQVSYFTINHHLCVYPRFLVSLDTRSAFSFFTYSSTAL